MATADEVLDIERSFLGEGGQRFWAWYPAAPGTAWCDIFQSYCLTAAGIDTHYAWVSAHFDHLRNDYEPIGFGWAGRCTTNIRWAEPGDLLAFEWNSTPGGYDHIAMVESVDANGVTAINGNVNGSRVQRLWHSFATGGIAEIARPPYETPAPPTPTPPAPPIPKDEDEVKRYLIKGPDRPHVYLADAGLGWKWHIPAGQVQNVVWVVTIPGGGEIVTPPGATTISVENNNVWVADQAFVDAIPTLA